MPFAFVLIWSTGFIVAKYAAPHAPPLTFLLYRFAGAIAVLLPIIVLTGAPWPRTARAWRDIVVVGVLLQATYLGGVWVAIALGMRRASPRCWSARSRCSRRCSRSRSANGPRACSGRACCSGSPASRWCCRTA
jgi:hypothetical protein